MMSAATRRMVGRIQGDLRALGIVDHDERVRVVSSLIYRRVKSTNELTFDEARVCITTLDGIDREQLPSLVAAGQRWLERAS